MTPNTSKSLSDIFDVELTTTDKSVSELKINAKNDSIDSLEAQREYVKKNIVSLIEKGTTALDEMIEVAKSTEIGKDYKVVSDMVAALVDHNIKLLDTEVAHKPKELSANEGDASQQLTQNNTVFVGSTSELSKFLKNSGSSNIIENK